MADGQKDDIESLEKRIKALEDDTDYQQIKSLKNEINLRVGAWERFSKWYYSVVTFIVLAFIATLSLAIGFFGRNIVENWAKKDATQYIEERTKSSLEFNDLYSRGAGEYLDGKYEKAIASFTKALETKPDKQPAAFTHNYMGLANYELGNPYKAFESFSEAIRLFPEYAVAHSSRGSVNIYLNKYKKAFEDLNRATALYIIKPDYEKAKANIIKTKQYIKNIERVDKRFDEKMKKPIEEKIKELEKKLKEAEKKGKVLIK